MNPPAHKSGVGLNTLYRAEALSATPADSRLSNVIAHWQFDAQEWRQFLDFDRKKRQNEDTRQAFVIAIILVLAFAAALFIGAVQAFAGLLIFAGIIGLGVLAHFFLQARREKQMETAGADGSGEIYITPEGVWTNGVWFDWGEDTAWRLATVTPVLASMGVRLAPGVPSYIEFRCRGRAPGRHRVRVDKKWRVPVPAGKQDEALEVFRYFGKPSATRDKFGLPDD